MTNPKICDTCGEKYTPMDDESPETHMCDECFSMLPNDLEPDGFEYMSHSDADPGL